MKLKKFMVLIFAIFLMIFFTSCSNKENVSKIPTKENGELMVYSGAGLRKPMDEIGDRFFEKTGVKINYNYAGSARILSQLDLTREGDVFIPGAKTYIEMAQKKELVEGVKDLVYHIPVIGVPKGNPKNITCLEDLTKPGIRVILGDERACAIGKVAHKMLSQNKLLKEVEKNVVSKGATVNEVVVHTAMGEADACIVWEDNVTYNKELEAVEINKEKNIIKKISISILTFSKNKEVAQQYIDFVSSDESRKIFANYGFKWIE